MTAATEQRPALLNQIIAVRTGVKADSTQSLTTRHRLLGKAELLRGMSRTYQPQNDEGFRYPDEVTQVQVKAEVVLRDIAEDLTRMFDVTAAMDWTNQHAHADVVIMTGDEPFVLLSAVPVSYLMFLEKALTDLETLVVKLPTLDPAEAWTFDPNADIYRSDPVGTVKTTKVRRNHVLAPPTERHPAQVESFTEDVPIGTWSTVKFSGALPATRVNKMLLRVKALKAAVKFAREQANMVHILDPKPGRRVFEYLFAPEA